jgi:FAD/FMN-containing dehydrogenase
MKQLQNGIVLDMRSINHMQFDAQKQQVTVGGGILVDDFTKYVHSLGMEVSKSSEYLFVKTAVESSAFGYRPVPFPIPLRISADRKYRHAAVGSCPTTGIIGVSFGAGLGRLQGKYGYLNDNMVSCKLVLADSSTITASHDSHRDLFWAIRGAGHNFGIALEATFRVYPQTNQGIHHTWDFGYRLEKCEEVFELLNHVHHVMPPELAIFVLWRRESAGGEKVKL